MELGRRPCAREGLRRGLLPGGKSLQRADEEAAWSAARFNVFQAPCRPAVCADSYWEASEINQRLTGKRLPRQTWGIERKIRKVE
ncbi:DUF429 domain-containing protein [Desulfosoma caldarium]|uniref:DUF429 domain-containing protein n=1 Tax=Desulfosoma caldarium TaxID=610254 RepID=UPI0038B2AFF6